MTNNFAMECINAAKAAHDKMVNDPEFEAIQKLPKDSKERQERIVKLVAKYTNK